MATYKIDRLVDANGDEFVFSDSSKAEAGTASPLMDGKASVGNSLKYAREDHVHPSDTSREDKANKTTVVLGTSDLKYPTDKAVAEFVNSSIATNTANYISNNGEPFTSVAQLEAYSGPVTNNDYAFVTGTDSEGNTYYDRYKATVSGETVTWALEYRLNNSSFTAAQWSAINSGITSALVDKIHEHSNKAVLDGITATYVSNWNNKLDKNGDGSNVTVGFTDAENRTNIATGSKLSTLFGQIRKWFTDLKSLAFKDKVGTGDMESGTYGIDISGNAATASAAASGSALETVINAKADRDNSVAIFDGYTRRLNESPGWRRIAYKQFNFTNTNLNALFRLYLFGSNNEHIGLGNLVVNVRFNSSGSAPELITCSLTEYKPLDTLVKVRVIGVAGNAVVELWFKPLTFSMLTLTCLGNALDVISREKDWTFGRYLSSTDPEPVEDIANNVYVFSGITKRFQLNIDNPTSGNLVAMDKKGLVKDSGIRITSTDVANWNSKQNKLTFDPAPTDGSPNPVTSEGIYKSMYRLSKPATPSSFTKDGKSYSFVCRTNVGVWKKAVFEGYSFPVDYQTFDMIRIRSTVYDVPPKDKATISISCGRMVYERFNFFQAIYNGYCYIFANIPSHPLYITPNKYIDSDTKSSSMTQDIFQTLTLTQITPSIDDVILEDTPKNNSHNPITSGGVKTAIDKLQSKLTFDTTPTSGSTNPVTSEGIKTAIDNIDAKGITVKEISGEQVICFE